MFSKIVTFLEPVTLSGDGKYNMDVVKEIKVTDSNLGLQMEDRGCQNEEPQEDCIARYYKDTFLQECGCLPFSMSTLHNVKYKISSI